MAKKDIDNFESLIEEYVWKRINKGMQQQIIEDANESILDYCFDDENELPFINKEIKHPDSLHWTLFFNQLRPLISEGIKKDFDTLPSLDNFDYVRMEWCQYYKIWVKRWVKHIEERMELPMCLNQYEFAEHVED